MPLVARYGAAVIALTIDEQGMAKTAERKLAVARRIHEIVTTEYGLPSEMLIFDALTFTLATGDAATSDDRRSRGHAGLHANLERSRDGLGNGRRVVDRRKVTPPRAMGE